MKKILLLKILLTCLLQLHAQEGTLDPTFANNGVKHLGINYNAVAFQSDGKLIGVLIVTGGFYLSRYDTNGNLDPSFCCGGTPTIIPGIIGTPTAVNIAIQNNNNFVVQIQGDGVPPPPVGGTAGYHRILAYARFDSNGVPDTNFGTNGLVINSFQGTAFPSTSIPGITGIAIQSDEKIITAGQARNRASVTSGIGRLNSNGIGDTSFHGPNLNSMGTSRISDLIIVHNDKILVAGSTATNPTAPVFPFLHLLNSDGTLDRSFQFVNVINIFGVSVTTAAMQNDGKILAAVGTFQPGPMLIRFHPDGTVDSTFGINGIVNTPFAVSSIIFQQNGKIIVAGSSIARYNSDGSLDSSFGTNGISISPGTIIEMLVVGNRIYATSGSAIFAFQLITNCIPPSFLNTDQIVLNASCGNSDGNLSIIPISGTGPFMYSKDGGASYVAGTDAGYTFDNLPAGFYNLRIKDATGCESPIVQREVQSIGCSSCTPPTFLNNDQIVLNASCGGYDGNLSIIPISGIAPFMYSKDGGANYISGPDGGYTFENLPAGFYNLRLKDANGCESATVQREVQSGGCPSCIPPVFLNNLQIILAASCGNNDGNISIIPTSGLAPFMYSINGGSTYIPGPDGGYTFDNLPAGFYLLRLKDATGCESATIQREVKNRNNCSSIAATSNLSEATISPLKGTITTYPNPSRGQFKLQLQDFTASKAEILVFDSRGTVIHTRAVNITGRSNFDFDLTGKAKGIYYIKIVSKNGTQFSKVLIQ